MRLGDEGSYGPNELNIRYMGVCGCVCLSVGSLVEWRYREKEEKIIGSTETCLLVLIIVYVLKIYPPMLEGLEHHPTQEQLKKLFCFVYLLLLSRWPYIFLSPVSCKIVHHTHPNCTVPMFLSCLNLKATEPFLPFCANFNPTSYSSPLALFFLCLMSYKCIFYLFWHF